MSCWQQKFGKKKKRQGNKPDPGRFKRRVVTPPCFEKEKTWALWIVIGYIVNEFLIFVTVIVTVVFIIDVMRYARKRNVILHPKVLDEECVID